ncbi:DUF882 domain-containing protein [Neomegalonema perideroedes]|uniref:DUF882 domain-containing protein n=1 Tax=Neomegalonema perideroedes TaxID=217219 RepID=UPI00036670D3|nr:DUF882 domain-containing protein [Neomegalonema perideroedes]
MADTDQMAPSRRRVLQALSACAFSAVAAPAAAAPYASPLPARKPVVRRLNLTNAHTGETFSGVYFANGAYVRESLTRLNYLLRDWRNNEIIAIDRRTLDIVSQMQRDLDTDEPFNVISAYRTPATNAMLRERDSAVASRSYHLRGMAMDLRLKTRSVEQIRRAASEQRAGGVGAYANSRFVHVDSGPLRSWRG